MSRRDAISRPNSTASDFDYDLASRLTLLTQNVSGTTNDLSRSFTYNGAGQLKTRVNATAAHWLAATPGSSAYAANGRNQYTTVAGATFGYDLNGNLTSTGTRSYGYDAENRLTSVSGGASLSLTYDPLGRLRQTTAGATTTDFLYEGDRLLAEYNGATLLRRYAHGPGVDEPIVWYEGSGLTTKRWLHPDERGSIVAWTDAGGSATVYKYGPYGEPTSWDATSSRFRYTGQIALPEVGLYHYKARAYDPALGRFLQTDPVGYQDEFNLYAYVYNDPLNKADPSGKERCPTGETDCPTQPQQSTRVSEDVSKAAHATERGAQVVTSASAASTGFGPASTAIKSLATSKVAETIASKAGVVGLGADAITAGQQISEGQPREAVKTGLSAGERIAGAAIGAKLFGVAGGPFADITAPLGGLVGGIAGPYAMRDLNESIAESHPIDASTRILDASAQSASSATRSVIRQFTDQFNGPP